ncbi:unnamed protein product, partial [Discosporangium mesarthrocarpum]
EFLRGGGEEGQSCLRVIFRQISHDEPDAPFHVGVRVDDSGLYQVPECLPALPPHKLDLMIQELNETNDFASFVRATRRAFVVMA